MTEELVPCLGVIFTAAMFLVVAIAVADWDRAERVGVVLSFVGHCACGFAMIIITRATWDAGDMFAYHRVGTALARYLQVDFDYIAPEIMKLLWQRDDAVLPVWVFGVGSSTATMIGVVAFLAYLLDNSLYAIALVFSFVSFFSKMALYQVGRENLAVRYRPHMLLAILLLPSVVFWSSGLVKESLTVAGISLLVFGAHRLFDRRLVRGLLALVVGGVLVALTKPYVLFAFAISAGVWLYWRSAVRPSEGHRLRLRPLHVGLAALVVVGGVIALGQLFPRYSFTNLGTEVATLQGVTLRGRGGGSSYEFGDPTETSLGGQLYFAPVGLIYALFRPLLFEAYNVPMAMSALEVTFLTFALGRVLIARRWMDTWRMFVSSPFLVFAAVFALGVATAVGLSSTNLGTLVRYRMPILPFYAILLFVLGARPPPDANRGSP
jgi:hypothetical protein